MPKWRKQKDEPPVDIDENNRKEIVNKMKKLTESAPLDPKEANFDSESADAIILKQSVRKKRGKWWQLPKDLGL